MALDDHLTMSEGEARRDCKILGEFLNSLYARRHTFDEITQIEIQHAVSKTNEPFEE